eukprot:CAMPEP_0181169246 /NCGR_PEP_ID=MMETSP1096-20121128/709_1 /TAXON_ID=156174 ORGANISM="Chrysochromulina ericina, Strain CCMP281" /NCGR_SAMPLE_ID=MMETSP1096 /ASSEMBLY_ACC=CAM_ASM_000453 /LENGTH=210 /DNA_ID=CAMNT_0023256685 /DNA_START=129 /DNA_END=762 /DNA_ORIENTATION=-
MSMITPALAPCVQCGPECGARSLPRAFSPGLRLAWGRPGGVLIETDWQLSATRDYTLGAFSDEPLRLYLDALTHAVQSACLDGKDAVLHRADALLTWEEHRHHISATQQPKGRVAQRFLIQPHFKCCVCAQDPNPQRSLLGGSQVEQCGLGRGYNHVEERYAHGGGGGTSEWVRRIAADAHFRCARTTEGTKGGDHCDDRGRGVAVGGQN